MIDILIDCCDLVFQFYEVFDIEILIECECFSEYSWDIFDVVVEIVDCIVWDKFVIYNSVVDKDEFRFVDGVVEMLL